MPCTLGDFHTKNKGRRKVKFMCNLISELLAFVQTKVNIMDEKEIARLILPLFHKEEIVIVKILLFEVSDLSRHLFKRKKTARMNIK